MWWHRCGELNRKEKDVENYMPVLIVIYIYINIYIIYKSISISVLVLILKSKFLHEFHSMEASVHPPVKSAVLPKTPNLDSFIIQVRTVASICTQTKNKLFPPVLEAFILWMFLEPLIHKNYVVVIAKQFLLRIHLDGKKCEKNVKCAMNLSFWINK